MPTIYTAPVEDYVFLCQEVFGFQAVAQGEGHEGMDAEGMRGLLGEAARFFEEVWAPIDEAGDDQGCKLEGGSVLTPAGFKPAYQQLCAAGWNNVEPSLEHAGVGIARVVAMAVREFASSACNSLGLYAGLTNGACATLEKTGAPWMQAHVVEKMRSGTWTGTMCLTEPHCGTDLRLMKTRAVEQADGSYRVSGTKIFISGGDHDLAENIIHLVLAKVPDAEGQISNDLGAVNLFMVAKQAVDPQTGAVVGANGVVTGGVERKMGLKGNATCTLHFENCVAYRLGQTKPSTADEKVQSSSAGMSGMFEMMNGARLGTGMQALASAQRAYTSAANYARERTAGRAADPADRSGGPADPLIVHPDVRRLLLKQAAFIEGARALGVWVRQLLDEQHPTHQAESVALASLLTPVVKAFFTDRAFDATNEAMQIYGGHGYIHDNGIEQLVRDARIFQLYEGANGVQAFDLVMRKLPAEGGRAFQQLLTRLRALAAQADGDPRLAAHAQALRQAAQEVESAAMWIGDKPHRSPYDMGGASYDFLTMMGLLSLGFIWLQIATASTKALATAPQSAFHQRKLALARYWFERELPLLSALQTRIRAGSAGLMELPADVY